MDVMNERTMNSVDGKWIVAFIFLPKASIVELNFFSKQLISLINDIFFKNMVIEFTWNHQILCCLPRNKIIFLHNIFPNFLGLQYHELLAQHQCIYWVSSCASNSILHTSLCTWGSPSNLNMLNVNYKHT